MTHLSHKGRDLITESIDEHLDDFDATPIHNRVCEADDGDDLVTELALAAERAYFAMSEASDTDRDYTDPIRKRTDDAYVELRDALQTRITELVAEACAQTLRHADEWDDHYETDELQASKQQARDWLDAHEDVAERADVLEVVDA